MTIGCALGNHYRAYRVYRGGTIVTDSTYLGTMVDDTGTSYDQTYGVEYSVTEGATSVTLTHRVSTSTTGAVDLGRTDIDRSVVIPVRTL